MRLVKHIFFRDHDTESRLKAVKKYKFVRILKCINMLYQIRISL